MGRTQETYRMRLQQLESQLKRYKLIPKGEYQIMWEASQRLSAPASTLPYPDTHAIATFSMLLDAIRRLELVKERLE